MGLLVRRTSEMINFKQTPWTGLKNPQTIIMNEIITFGDAIEALKQGKRISRTGWNGKGMFVFKQIPAEIGLDIIPKMQSVPQSVKDVMIEKGITLKYSNQMAIVNAEGRVDSWVASSSDTLAEDWCILD